MPDEKPQTAPQSTPAGPGDGTTPPAATPAPDGSGAAPVDDEMVTIRKSDLKNLQSTRDRNYEDKTQLAERLDEFEAIEESRAQKEGITEFLSSNKEKYPDLTFEDLKYVTDPTKLEQEADRLQRRLEDHTQAKILDIEQHGHTPRLSPEQRAEREAELKKKGGPAALEEAIALRMSPK